MARPRKQNTRDYIPTIYAIVEGEETEASYVKYIKSQLGTDSRIELLHEHHGSARITMFKRAKEILGDSDTETQVWIICDVDDEADKISHLRSQKFRGSDRLLGQYQTLNLQCGWSCTYNPAPRGRTGHIFPA